MPHSSTKPKSKEREIIKGRTSKTFKSPHVSGLPSLSPDTEESGDDPFASFNTAVPNRDDDLIEIGSQDYQSEDIEREEQERRERIPPDLLTRLLYENFKEEGTRLSKDASRAVGKYMETFVRESLARAAFARVEAEEKRGGMGDGFLEVEDLEILAPQLLLDF